MTDGYQDLPLANIEPNPNQPRKNFDEDALQELAASILQHGLMQPIVVRPSPAHVLENGGADYQIIAGERRYRAARIAGLSTIPARVMTVDDETTTILAITENVARRDMDEIEEAGAYASLVELGKTVAEIAGLFGKTEKAIETSLELLNLTDQLQWLVAKRQVSKNIGVYLSRLTPAAQQATLARITAGEFTDNDALARHCTVMQKVESQGAGFFADAEADPFTEARRAARKTEIERAWAKIEALSGGLTPMLEMAPEDMAFAIGPGIVEYAAKLSVIATAVNRVRNNVRQAAAIAKIVLPAENAGGYDEYLKAEGIEETA